MRCISMRLRRIWFKTETFVSISENWRSSAANTSTRLSVNKIWAPETCWEDSRPTKHGIPIIVRTLHGNKEFKSNLSAPTGFLLYQTGGRTNGDLSSPSPVKDFGKWIKTSLVLKSSQILSLALKRFPFTFKKLQSTSTALVENSTRFFSNKLECSQLSLLDPQNFRVV